MPGLGSARKWKSENQNCPKFVASFRPEMRIVGGRSRPMRFPERCSLVNERTIFMTAMEKEDSAQRRAYLDTACGGDPALRERVETLLRSHEREGKFLDVPAVEQLIALGPRQDPGGCTQEALAASTD